MTRSRDPLRQLQRTLYLASRLTGDISAARRGRLGRRLVRRAVTRRGFGPLLNRLFR